MRKKKSAGKQKQKITFKTSLSEIEIIAHRIARNYPQYKAEDVPYMSYGQINMKLEYINDVEPYVEGWKEAPKEQRISVPIRNLGDINGILKQLEQDKHG